MQMMFYQYVLASRSAAVSVFKFDDEVVSLAYSY